MASLFRAPVATTIAVVLLSTLLLSLTLCASEGMPAAVPTGMDLLYSDRIPFGPDGEPLIAVGLMTGQMKVSIRGRDGLRLDFFDEGTLKQALVPQGQSVDVTVLRATRAQRRFIVDLEAVGWSEPEQLAQRLTVWRARGHANVEALAEGTALGIGGRLLDTRGYHIVLPAESAAAAGTVASEVYERFAVKAAVRALLVKRPWARLTVSSSSQRLGTATSFVRIASAGSNPVEVLDVEHGVGYAWHGRETRQFHGEIYVAIDPDGKLAAVNVLGAETILAGVVPSEMFASAPTEALKAQAVAARNQLFAKLGQRHHDEPFHLCASQHCQVYAGLAKEDPRATAAVRATAGELLFRDGRLVDTVYSSSCGGHTGSKNEVWGGASDPALIGRPDFDLATHPELAPYAIGITPANLDDWLRGYPITYCSQASKARPDKFRWQRTLDRSALERMIGAVYPTFGALVDLEVEERGAGGRIITLRLRGAGQDVSVVHELPIRRLFDNLPSGAFTIEKLCGSDGAIVQVVLRGAGWGHGVGMCQMGAIGRAEAGQTYQQILAAYYSGALVEVLYAGASAP